MRSNLTGHTIFLTSEKYRVTNQKPDTIFFTSEKIRISFSRLLGRSCEVIESECLQRSLLYQSHGFKVCRHLIIQWNNLSRTKKTKIGTKKKTQENVALLKEFLTLRNESRLIGETPPKELNASLNLSLRFERKTATNTMNSAPYVLWCPVLNRVFKEEELRIQHYERRRV